MPKKSNKKTFSSEEKGDRSHNRKSKNLPEEEDEYEDNEIEDEENEEEEEEEENDGFIVHDNEDESYGPDNRNIYRDESIFNKGKREEKRDKKERNLSENESEGDYSDQREQNEAELDDSLNESDLEVAREKKHKKKKKLHRTRDIDKDEIMREREDLKSDDENYSRKSSESEIKNRNIKKTRNNSDDSLEYRKDRKKKDDFIVYGDQSRPRRDRAIEKSLKTQLLEQEIITEEDKAIIEADYPERLLMRFKEEDLLTLSQEIKPELEWICEEKNYNDSPTKKKKISTLLEFLKKDFLDIPYIITYKYYIFEHDLTKRELWEIYELDKEYQKLMDLKKKVITNFDALEPYLNEKVFHDMKERCIDNAKTIQDLKNMMNYINYNREKHVLSSNKDSENKNEYQGPIRKSILSVCFSENLDKCTRRFCLEPNEIASNIELIKNKENLSKLRRPPEPECSLSELLAEYKSKNLPDHKVMENISNLIGREMINHPYIKEFVYEYYRNNCYVSTNPTEEGNKQLDVFHPSFRTKRIRDRPIKTFNDDLFLDILQREKEKLIEISIQIKENEDESKEFKYIFTQALNSEQNDYMEINDIKQEPDAFNEDDNNMNYNKSNNKSDWYLLRRNVIKIFFESIQKQFIIDIRKELKEKAEDYVIKECSDKFYRLLMSGPYVVNISELYANKRKELENKKKDLENKIKDLENKRKDKDKKYSSEDSKNKGKLNIKEMIEKTSQEIEKLKETDAKFKDDELPKVMSFIYNQSENCTYCVALNQNGELVDEKIFNFHFQKRNRLFLNKQNSNDEKEPLSTEDLSCMKFIEEHGPNLIIIGANDLEARFIKEKITSMTGSRTFKLQQYIFITFGDLSIPTIYSNSPISENEFPKQNMYIKQAVSLGRYQQNPLQEILQLWKDDINENYCLKIKLHPMQKYVDQGKLMEKMETKAIEVVNLCGFDINKALEFSHLRNTLQFISGFGPRKAKAFIKQLYAIGKPKTREEILEDKNYGIGSTLGESFINFIKIKTDITYSNSFQFDGDYNLLDMTRIPIEEYGLAQKLINDVKKEENNKKQKKKNDEVYDKVQEILRNPDKLNILDINEYIKKQSENLKGIEIDHLKFMLKLIKEELTHPFRDLRDERKDLQQQQIFHLLIGDENFQKGMITVAKVLRIDPEHVQCKLQNDLAAALWFNDILEDSEIEKGSKEKIKALFKPGSAFEARIKNIDYTNYKVDLMTKPSEMRTHKNYIPNVEQLSNFFELTDEDRLNIPYINAHSQKNKKYQPRNIKNDRFRNISYTDCCNYLRNKEIGECIFRPSSMGNNNITLSYKFYKQIICHLDIIEEDKQPGDNIGKKLKISNEVYSSLDEILKRYVVPCAQLIKESIKNRKFIHSDTKTDFENSLKEEKKRNTNIINYNYTILKDFPGYIVLGYVPKVNPIYEYIKIKPKGLYFHEQSFSSLDEITNYFKKEYSSEKYREMVRKSVAPTVQYHRSLESHSNINLDESKNYYSNYSFGGSMGLREGSIYGINRNKQDDRTCKICQKKGHIARNCKNRDSYMNEKRRNERGSSNYLGGKRNRDNRDSRDNYEHKKNYGGWDNRERAHGNNNWNSKDNNDENSWGHNSKKSDDNKGNDDGWGSDNNENQNNIKTENKNNIDDGW